MKIPVRLYRDFCFIYQYFFVGAIHESPLNYCIYVNSCEIKPHLYSIKILSAIKTRHSIECRRACRQSRHASPETHFVGLSVEYSRSSHRAKSPIWSARGLTLFALGCFCDGGAAAKTDANCLLSFSVGFVYSLNIRHSIECRMFCYSQFFHTSGQ